MKKKKTQVTAVPLDCVPERRTIMINHDISARGSLVPTGGASCRYLVPDKALREGRVYP